MSAVSSIITNCLKAVGINETDTEYRERALIYLNMTYLNRLKGRHWKFMNRDLFIDLKPPYETGTVTLTQDSSIVQEDTVPAVLTFNSTHVGQAFAPGSGSEDLFRVGAIVSPTQLSLLSLYSGVTALAQPYKIIFDRIQLETGVQAIRSLLISGLGEIKPTGLQEFRAMKSRNPTLVGPPQCYTLVKADTGTGQWTVELYPAPDKRYSCQIDYTLRPVELTDSGSSFTLIPPDHMDVLYYGVLSDLYRYQENATMAESAARTAANSWLRFASDQEMTDSVARLQMGRKYFNRNKRYTGYYGLKWFGRVDD